MTLSAALEDAEGIALVEDILFRKKLRNSHERFIQLAVFGEVATDGHGNVIPRALPPHWDPLKHALADRRTTAASVTRSLNKPTRIGTVMEGSRQQIIWLDEMAHAVAARLDQEQQERDAVGHILISSRPIPPRKDLEVDTTRVKWSNKAAVAIRSSNVDIYTWLLR